MEVYLQGYCVNRLSIRKTILFLCLFSCIASIGVTTQLFVESAYAEAKQSTLTLELSSANISLNIMPTENGTFGNSGDAIVTVRTDNFSGYTLKISATGSGNMETTYGDVLSSISSITSETDFQTSSAYNNKWGYKPSQYFTVENETPTKVINTSNYLPAPTSNGDTLDITNIANSTENVYAFSLGARVDMNQPADVYNYTYVVTAVANAIIYNVTYNQNSNETVTDMPSPNPQVVTIDGATPAAESYATLSSSTPVLSNKTFGGWCDVQPTTDSNTGNHVCSGNTYSAGGQYPIDQTVSGANITLYAIWLVDPFPIVWSQMGKCEFNGATNSNITGSECQDYANVKYIDTGIPLYNNANWAKDYEIHFTIDHYNPDEQNNSEDSQQTFVSDKLGSHATDAPYNGKAPGIIVRRSKTQIQIRNSFGQGSDSQNASDIYVASSTTNEISIYRIDKVIYVSVNSGPLMELQDITNFNQQFELTTWFGAYPSDGCTGNDSNPIGYCGNVKRFIEADLSNMYIRLGDFDDSNLHTITFSSSDATPASTTYKVLAGHSLGTLPTAEKTGWVFDGWWTAPSDGQQIGTNTVPTGNDVYYAHWKKAVSQAEIADTNIIVAINGTATISVTNSADLEPYTFTSNSTSVATVNSSTGAISGVSAGTTTITMTGTKSHTTQTINVIVANSIITVHFDAQGGSGVSDRTIGEGSTLSEIPGSTKTDYILDGWYTGTNGTGTKLTTETVFNTNTPTQYYAYWVQNAFVCKLATTLHQEACGRSSGGCYAAGYGGRTVTYGQIADSSTMTYGDAYTCDVNSNGVYDEENERFYYIGTTNGNATFIYYRSTQQSVDQDYQTALADLPTSATWTNQNLTVFDGTRVSRLLKRSEVQTVCNKNVTLPTQLGYNGNCVYLMEESNFTTTTRRDGIWLEMEGENTYRIHTQTTQVTKNTQANTARPVIEVPLTYVQTYTYTITFNSEGGSTVSDTYAVTPGERIGRLPQDPTRTNYVFQGWFESTSGGTAITINTIPSGTTEYHAQWKKEVTLAELASNNITIVTGNTATINVTNAADLEPYTFTSNDSTIASVDSSTGEITAISEGSTYITMEGTSSHTTKRIDVTVADASNVYNLTFNSEGGVPATATQTVVAGGQINTFPTEPTRTNYVFQGWFENTSGGTAITTSTVPSGDTTYHAQWKLNVQQAVISNNDLTLSEGGQITIIVSNSSDLEGYTFSSNDTSIATVNANTGVITGVGAGTTYITMAGTQSNLTKQLEVEVTAAPATMYTVTFNANGGTITSPETDEKRVEDGTAVGSLPTPTKTNHKFFGWYKDDGTFYQEVYPEEIIDDDVTFYAKWVEDTTNFPIVWSEINACTFSTSANVSGDYCASKNNSSAMNKKYIDTAVQLFTQANYNKDFEVGFTIVTYDETLNSSQATFVNSKQENSSNNYPGFVVRRYTTTTDIEITEKWKGNNGVSQTFASSSVHSVRIFRRTEEINGDDHIMMYYAINGGTLTPLQDITNITHIFFDTNVWFGMSVKSDGTSTQRPLVGTLTDMYIRLGADTDYTIDLNPNGGQVSPSSITVPIGSQLGNLLPTPTPPNANYTFDAWYDESVTPAQAVSSSTTPDGNKTYVAHYNYVSTTTPVQFEVSNAAMRGYNTIVTGYAPQISTFNEDTTTVDSQGRPSINFSTWGVAKTTYLSSLQNNFESNNCMLAPGEDSAIDWGGSHTVNCSKPDTYDTTRRTALNVYLWDTTNQTTISQVAYTQSDDGIIRNMIPGKSYYWEEANDNTIYGVVTATSVNNRRLLDVGDVWNVRDLGGLPVDTNNDGTIDGTLEYGKLIRGGRLNTDSNNVDLLIDLGVDKEYDLANSGELSPPDTQFTGSDYVNDTVIHYNFDYGTAGYSATRQAVTDVMNEVINGNNIFFHCRVGADRTGTLAYLLEGLLGVPNEYRYQDYELTSVSGLNDRTRYYAQKSDTNYYKFLYMMGYALTNQDIYDWYTADTSDVNAATRIASFRSAMISSGAQQQQNNNNNNAPAQTMSTMSIPNNSQNSTSSIINNTGISSGTNNNATDSYVAPLSTSKKNYTPEKAVPSESASITAPEIAVMATATTAAVAGGLLLANTARKQSKE